MMTYEQIIEVVDHLTPQEQAQLTTHLLEVVRHRKLTTQEKMSLLRAVQVDVSVFTEPSTRREDWYGDDGR